MPSKHSLSDVDAVMLMSLFRFGFGTSMLNILDADYPHQGLRYKVSSFHHHPCTLVNNPHP